MKSKIFCFLILLILILVSVPSVAFAAEGTATSSWYEITDRIDILPSIPSSYGRTYVLIFESANYFYYIGSNTPFYADLKTVSDSSLRFVDKDGNSVYTGYKDSLDYEHDDFIHAVYSKSNSTWTEWGKASTCIDVSSLYHKYLSNFSVTDHIAGTVVYPDNWDDEDSEDPTSEQQPTTNSDNSSGGDDSEPETTTDWELREDYDGYGLLQPVGEFVEDLRNDFSGFSDMAHDSADDLRGHFSGMSDFLNDLFTGLPGILLAVIIFVLIFYIVRKIVGR